MDYTSFVELLENHGFGKERCQILKSVAENYDRFKSQFSPYSSSVKILQNLLTSCNSRFGNSLINIVRLSLENSNVQLYDKPKDSKTEKILSINHVFQKNTTSFFIKQKLRDDHDTSARIGIVNSLDSAAESMKNDFGGHLIGILYFIDPSKRKNEKYFTQNLKNLSKKHGFTFYLFYGDMLFNYLGIEDKWISIVKNFDKWQKEASHLPNLNFDENSEISFKEIKYLNPKTWKILLQNKEIWGKEPLLTIFPDGATLKLLHDYFGSIKESIFEEITELLKIILEKYYTFKMIS